MSNDHIEDRAELYALGALDRRESATIETHVRTCPSCAQVVGSAERDVALVASMEPRRKAPRELSARIERAIAPSPARWHVPAALAAALLVGLLPSAYFWTEYRAQRSDMLVQSAAMERIASVDHRSATFRPTHGALAAQVIYGSDGSWYVVVVRDTSRVLGVAWMHDGERTMLGNAIPHGKLATLYLPKSHRMDRLALMDGDRIVAQATLTWQKTLPNRQGARSG